MSVQETQTQLTFATNGQPQLGTCRRGKPVWAYDDAGFPVCGASLAHSSGQSGPKFQCQSRFRMRSGRCRVHGGASKAGLAQPAFLNGENSTKMPRHLQSAYQRILKDPDLMSVQKDIAVDEVYLEELGAQLENGFDSLLITRVSSACENLALYLDGPNGELIEAPDEFLAQVEELLNMVAEGNDPTPIWDAIQKASSHKANLIKLEQQILRDNKNSITAEEAKVLVTAIVICVQREAANFHAQIYNTLMMGNVEEAKALLKTSLLSQKIASRVQQLTSDPEYLMTYAV